MGYAINLCVLATLKSLLSAHMPGFHRHGHIFPMDYLANCMLIMESIHILLSHSITQRMLMKAEKMIKHYCFKISYYYSDHQMTANIHQLLHLPIGNGCYALVVVEKRFHLSNQMNQEHNQQ